MARLWRYSRSRVVQKSAARYNSSRPDGANYFTDDRTDFRADLMTQLPTCHIINLHLVANFVDFQSFFRVGPRRSPLVWTLHDPNPFTGGCHYYDACRRYNSGCGACPELGSSVTGDLSREIWQRKKAAYSFIPDGRLHLVAPSRWLADEARKSALLGKFPVSVIPYGLDTEVFSPRNRMMAREALDLPRDAKVVLFAAADVKDHRKGFTKLTEALAPLPADSGIHVVALGRNRFSTNIRLPNLSLGFIDNERILSLAYSAADLYVTPTLDDNLPNTVMEAMSCGTPVVGFEVGGVPDMVRNGVSGFVVPRGDTCALRQAILSVLDNPALRTEMSQNCRRIAVEEYGIQLQAQRYLALYQSITTN
jgi:glycosyltransferase involved in cell wall biosynthesis